MSRGIDYRGMPVIYLLLPILLFLILLLIARTKYYKLSAYLLVTIYYLSASYAIYNWGFILPTGLLIYSLVIIMTGILIGTVVALIASCISTFTIILIAHLQSIGFISPDLFWTAELIEVDDALVYVAILGVITVVSWLSNREIDKSLKRAHESEAALKNERDMLEITVTERTRELRQAQLDQMAQLYRFAELGQMSAALLHDIANPLTTVSLNLEQLERDKRSQLVKRARQGIQQMQDFITSARRQLQAESHNKTFSANNEIRQALAMLSYRLKKAKISVTLDEQVKMILTGNEVKFHQLMTNLISNAIDASDDSITNRTIIVRVLDQGLIEVQDHGKGIIPEDQEKIFEPFFGTKKDRGGMGLGLAICRDIMEKEFGGTISLQSEVGKGTCFKLQFPPLID